MPRIENWLLVNKRTLDGQVYDHPKYPDGHTINTSRVVHVLEGKSTVITNSGSRYELGEPHPYMSVLAGKAFTVFDYLEDIVQINGKIFEALLAVDENNKISCLSVSTVVQAEAIAQGYLTHALEVGHLELTFKGRKKLAQLADAAAQDT